MIASLQLPPEVIEAAADTRAREVAALQAAWAELDEAHRELTRRGVGGGSLAERIRLALPVRFDPREVSGFDILDSLVGCALTAQQLSEDTGREPVAVHKALHRLLDRRLVWRERCRRAWVYRVTPLGLRIARGGR